MAPRKKKSDAPAQEVLPPDINQTSLPLAPIQPASLIEEYFTLKSHDETQSKLFQEYIGPTRQRMEEIKSTLHAAAIAQKVNGFPTDSGTAYLSTIVNYRIDPDSNYTNGEGRISAGRDALLDWMLDNWDDYGSEGAQINVSKDVVDKWMQEHEGAPPPGLKIEQLIRCNIKRS